MTNPSSLMGCPNPSKFPDCPGHDPRRCSGHKGGRQCGRYPVNGARVCPSHGGRAPRVKAAAAVRVAEADARRRLGRIVSTPVENPLEELQELAGKAKAWMVVCEEHMAELERLRYSTEGGEHIRGEVVLFERAVESCRKVLVDVARLNIDERLTRVGDRLAATVSGWIDAVLADQGLDPADPVVRAKAQATLLRLVAAEQVAGAKTIEGRVA